MNTLLSFISNICILWTGFSLAGYIAYKGGIVDADSWEGTIKKLVYHVGEALYEMLAGKPVDRKIINTGLILSNQEALELTKKFDGHPYDTPTLTKYMPNVNGCSWYDIAGMGLIEHYQQMDNQEVAQMAFHVIQNYFMEVRNVQVAVRIQAATPKRLYFAVALSGDSIRYLDNMRRHTVLEKAPEQVPENPEEEIPLFEAEVNDRDTWVPTD